VTVVRASPFLWPGHAVGPEQDFGVRLAMAVPVPLLWAVPVLLESRGRQSGVPVPGLRRGRHRLYRADLFLISVMSPSHEAWMAGLCRLFMFFVGRELPWREPLCCIWQEWAE